MAIDARKVLRLNMPQWQGGDRPNYRIGGRVLAAIAPRPQGPEETVLVPRAGEDERPIESGIVSREALLAQLAAARSAIDRHAPEAIVTLGGDCHVDLAPIAYLSERYGDDLAVLWVDAHPDIVGPERDRYAHTHVLATLMGEGDPEFVAAVRRPVDPKRILYVGLTETSPFEADFIRKHGIARLSPEDLAGSPQRVLEWLRASGERKVAVTSTSMFSIPRSTTSPCSTIPSPRRAPMTRCPRVGCGLRRSPRSLMHLRRKPTSWVWPSPSTCYGARSGCPAPCACYRSSPTDRAAGHDRS
jgi:arginase